MMTILPLLIPLMSVLSQIAAPADTVPSGPVILCAPDASALEQYAAREVRRYIYLRMGLFLPIVNQMDQAGRELVVVMTRDNREWYWQALERIYHEASADFTDQALLRDWLDKDVAGLEDGGFLLRSMNMHYQRRGCVFLAGAGELETLYAAYRFAELLGIRFYLHGDVVPDGQGEVPNLTNLNERHAPLFALRGIQPFHDFPEGPDWWTLEHYRALITQLPKMGMNFLGLHTYPLAEPTVWVGEKEDVAEDGSVKKSYSAQYYNTGIQVGWGYAVRPTSRYACGASQLFPRDDYGADFLSPYTPRPDSEEENNAVFNATGAVFNEAFSQARELGIKTCIGTETPLTIPRYILDRYPPATGTVVPVSGSVARYGSPIEGTEDDTLYQSVRYNLSAYRFTVPEGAYTVTLKFSEVAYDTPGARVFDVLLQGEPVIEGLDIFARAGKNAALDYTFSGIQAKEGILEVGFRPVTEFPAIAAIAVEGKDVSLKVNCGGEAFREWAADAGMEADPALIQKVYEGMFTRIMRTHPLDYYWFWTPENWTWEGATEEQAGRTVRDLAAACAAHKAVNAPFSLATCGWVLGPPFDRAYLDHQLPKEVSVSTINRHLGYEPVDTAFGQITGRGKWVIPWVEDDPALASPQFWARRMRRDARSAHEYGCDGLMGIFWRTRGIAPTLACLGKAAWNQDWPDTEEPEGHYRLRYTDAGFPVYTAYTTADIVGTEDDPVYRTVRLDAKAYVLAVPNGTYQVVLHFCEGQQDAGARVFDVKLQGAPVLTDFDIAAEVKKHRALKKTFEGVNVTDGRLRIDLDKKKDWPSIAAIEVHGDGVSLKINCGAGAYKDFAPDVPQLPEDPSALDFYIDWATHEFGPEIGEDAGRLWHGIDGTHPRTSTWMNGPGNFLPDERPWDLVRESYAFVEAFEAMRGRVQGPANLERFDYWFHTLAYLRATGKMNCLWAAFNRALDEVKNVPVEQQAELARTKALPARIALVQAAAEAYTHLLGTVSTYGELGTVCNLEAHTFPAMLDKPAEELEKLLGAPLPSEACMPTSYAGPLRVIVPAIRTSRRPGEPLKLEVLTLSQKAVVDVVLNWRLMGEGKYTAEKFSPVARGVYQGVFSSFPGDADIEYYIEVTDAGNHLAVWPATAPTQGQTVIVHPEAQQK